MYYRLLLDEHVFHQIARDGNRATQITTRQEILLPPSSRAEVLIQGAGPGSYALRAQAFNTGPVGDSYDAATIATLVSQDSPVVPIALPARYLRWKTFAPCR